TRRRDLVLLMREQDADEVDDDVNRLERIDRGLIADETALAELQLACIGSTRRQVQVEHLRAKLFCGLEEARSIVCADSSFRQHRQRLARLNLAQLQDFPEHTHNVVVHSTYPSFYTGKDCAHPAAG